ncbi:hypothetical protein DH2020_004826 [Rehmannia glutinosa]|uniref:Uncharacterized protein n=1 Tax=Rehmannia glutinosa TaxID=99300 RepID=A0ABR0XQV1_REHGL
MNPSQKNPKTPQNGKGPPNQESQNTKSSPPSRNRGRRGRNGRKSDQGDAFMRPSSRPCTAADKPVMKESSRAIVPVALSNKSVENGDSICKSDMGFPSSSKSLTFPSRPGFGQLGTKCIVKANHFFAELPEKDLNQYDVTITPEVSSRAVNRAIIAELVKVYKESELGMKLPAYDGRKSLYTAGELPFAWKEFTIKLIDDEDNVNGPKRADGPKEALQILDIVLRELSIKRFCPVGRSFFSPDIRKPQRLGDGLEAWCGFYQSIRPTQMGLSLNIDMASAAFIEALPVIEFVAQLLGKDVLSRPLSDSDRIKVKKALRGVKVEVTHRGDVRRKYRVSGITTQPTRELVFPVDDNSTMKSVVEYFQEMYGFSIQYTHLPCLQVGNQKKANYLPMEACKIVEGQRYTKRLSEKQITSLLKVTCQRPRDRENDILQTVQHNAYDQDPYAKEFGIKISEKMASVEARVLPAPWLKYHETGKEKDCDLKRICETDLGLISQCCLTKHVFKINKQYLANVSLKINVKMGGRNTVLLDAISCRIPLVSDIPTIIFGADVTHPENGEETSPSIAAVVASQDWPEVTKYAGLVCAQAHRQELIQDLYKTWHDPVHVQDLLVSFRKATGQKPQRIIFYRDGVSEGQFYQVLLFELDAIRKACASLEPNYQPPVTFIVVQKRHHTRLFANNHRDKSSTDKSGNILPGTVVDSKICHPTEFDFYLCSHAGIQGTSRPAHYHVLWDENNFTADGIQSLTNNLCYTYARCTRSVSVGKFGYVPCIASFYWLNLPASCGWFSLLCGASPDIESA